ncbi:MAG: HlyC/CorC family transporter [Magnetospirillum sp.]|nr:HlyC/CorC family transporter [Magnetospirillum sp.]
MIAAIAAIVGLLLLLAFFGAAETALTVASKPLMHTLEAEGDRRAALVNRLRARKERLLGSILLGNTLVHILATSLATGVAIGLAGEAGIAYATAVMTVVVLIFAEIMPKTVAIRHANRVAVVLAPVMRVVVAVLGPAIHAIHLFVGGVLRLVGANASPEADVAAAVAELRGAIEVHATPDEVREERRMLRSILDLNDVEVGAVMTHRRTMTTVDAGLAADEVVAQILASPFTRIPLWRDDPDNIVGVVHSKDVLRALHAGGGRIDGLDVPALASPPWFIPESTTLLEQLQAFRQRHEHFALVVDEYGTLMGVVTLEDIIEEIVGDIADEHDVSVPGVRAQQDGSYVVAGTVTIRDLNREFEWRLPDDEAATLAGLILHESRQIPNVGQVFLFHGFRFEILRRHRNQLTSIRITPPAAA